MGDQVNFYVTQLKNFPSPHPPGPRTVMNNKRYLKKVGCERTCTLIIFDSGNNKWFARDKVLFSNGEG